MKIVIDIPKEVYNALRNERLEILSKISGQQIVDMFQNSIPLDVVTDEIKTLKHEHTDVSGYRWWNNAIDNALDIIRDIVSEQKGVRND